MHLPKLDFGFCQAEDATETYEELAVRLGLRPAKGWAYADLDGRPLGYIRVLPSGQSVKAVCRLHDKCNFFLNLHGDFQRGCKRLIRWLAAGAEPNSCFATHQAAKA